jgi:hypothetical protein
MSQIVPKESRALKTFRKPNLYHEVAITRDDHVHRAVGVATDIAPGSHYTHRVIALAVRLVVEDGLPYRAASWHLWRDHRVFVPFSTIQNWVEAGGKKGGAARRWKVPRRGAG